ncbi:hypothetical protein CSPX01_03953 [Colletotrichum filicis]|nr:hypothetical protein CSPX01_03953 [Colletotrichum filicis]
MWIALLFALLFTLTLIWMFYRIPWPLKAIRKRHKEKKSATKRSIPVALPSGSDAEAKTQGLFAEQDTILGGQEAQQPSDISLPGASSTNEADNSAPSYGVAKQSIRSKILMTIKTKLNGKGKSSGVPLDPRSPPFQPSTSSGGMRPSWLNPGEDTNLTDKNPYSARLPVMTVDGTAISGSSTRQRWQAQDFHINNELPTQWVTPRPFDPTAVQAYQPTPEGLAGGGWEQPRHHPEQASKAITNTPILAVRTSTLAQTFRQQPAKRLHNPGILVS